MHIVEAVTEITDWCVLRGAKPIDKFTLTKTGWLFYYKVEHERHAPKPTEEDDRKFMQETRARVSGAILKAGVPTPTTYSSDTW